MVISHPWKLRLRSKMPCLGTDGHSRSGAEIWYSYSRVLTHSSRPSSLLHCFSEAKIRKKYWFLSAGRICCRAPPQGNISEKLCKASELTVALTGVWYLGWGNTSQSMGKWNMLPRYEALDAWIWNGSVDSCSCSKSTHKQDAQAAWPVTVPEAQGISSYTQTPASSTKWSLVIDIFSKDLL